MRDPREMASIGEMLSNPEEYFEKKKFYGLYRGAIEDIEDPEKRMRVKVRVWGVHPLEDCPKEVLPWAENSCTDGGSPGYGDVTPMYVGEKVFVMFEQGDREFPVVIGKWFAAPEDVTEIPEDAKAGYPFKRVIRMKSGHKIVLSDAAGASHILIQDKSGNFVKMDTESKKLQVLWKGDAEAKIDGNVTVEVTKDVKATIKGKLEAEIGKDAKITIKGKANIEVKSNAKIKVSGNCDLDVSGILKERAALIQHN